jgi:ketosteroid isomerase-like protein
VTLTLQAISDRAEITDTCTRMAWLADRRDWSALLEVFDDQVELDYTSLTGANPTRLAPQQVIDDWAAGLGGLTATQHLVANHLVTVQQQDPQAAPVGDTAVCTATFQATHLLPNASGGPTWTLGGHYRYTLRRTPTGWRISGVTMTADWAIGNQQVMTLSSNL